MNDWLAWAWVIAVDLAVIVGVVFATYDRTLLASVRWQHVVAATIVAVMGWEGAANVVARVVGSNGFTAVDVAFLAAQAIFAVAALVTIFFVLRRRRWAVVLGIGLAAVRFLLAVLGVVQAAQFAADMEPGAFLGTATFLILAALPLLAAVWLFLDPFFRGQLEWRPAEPDAAPDPEADPEATGEEIEPPAEVALER